MLLRPKIQKFKNTLILKIFAWEQLPGRELSVISTLLEQHLGPLRAVLRL